MCTPTETFNNLIVQEVNVEALIVASGTYIPANQTCKAMASATLATINELTYQQALTPLIGWVMVVILGSFVSTSVLSSLSIRRSLKELMMDRHSRLDIVDVLRVIAIFWVMMNHTGSEGRVDILDRLPSADAFKKSVHEHPIFGALLGNSALGVEIFLVLSGLLAARSWLKNAKEPFGTHYIQFIVKRILRLLPSVIFFIYIAAGPIMKTWLPRFHSSMISSCGISGLISQVTFSSNWQRTPTCLGYLWYLGLDMQLYVAAPFFLQLLNLRPKTGALLATLIISLSAAIRAGYCRHYGVCNKSDVDIPFISYPGQDPESLDKIYGGLWEMYARPYTKCGPFIIGLLIGYATVNIKYQLTTKQSKAILFACITVAVGTIYAILPEYWYPDQGDTTYNTIYTAIFRTVFAVAIAGIILSYHYRKESVNWCTKWSVLARLTYNAYLLHMPIIYIFNYLPFLQSASGAMELLVVLPFVATLSFGAATVFYLLVESPLGYVTSSWVEKIGL